MPKYPSISDKNFYTKIANIYKKYKIRKTIKPNLENFCNPKKFELQLPQEFLSNFLSPSTPYKAVLVYHKIGAGKTCAAIRIAEKWKHQKKIYFVTPAALKGNVGDELRSLCGGSDYLTKAEREKLAKLEPCDSDYKQIIKVSNKRINKYYNILSYNKFLEKASDGKFKLNSAILIIDEIQNLVSDKGSSYKILKSLIDRSSEQLRIVLLSATPMFDKPSAMSLILNLMNIDIPTGKAFYKMFITTHQTADSIVYSVKNIDKFKMFIRGYVSYFSGAPSFTFPRVRTKYIECEMSEFQYEIYKKLLKKDISNKDNIEDPINLVDLPNNFYIGTRFVSNIVYPNKKTGEAGFKSLTTDKILKHLAKYSTKFDTMMEKVNNTRGKIFIYSAFKEHAGLKSIKKILEANGFLNYAEAGEGRKRYAVWSSDVSSEKKDEIKAVFNKKDNLFGKKLQLIIGSPSIKEGVTLKAVRAVHIVEPHWNQARLDQVIGRAVRFCSHKDLDESARTVKVYIYIATKKGIITVDQFIKNIAKTKHKIIKQFETAIKEAAIDCQLNVNSNPEPIKCDK